MKNNRITGASVSNSVIGTYEGEVLNPNITNKNGLDITMEVMENVLESDDYKDGIKYGWFIGFLGHPEDPNCMDFQNGCIVMTDMWIENNKIYGKFNLVDTPVGRTVKALQDAGVTFGISIRGAGDIIDNSVDPESFVFRGFDLVSFPAYPDSIPKFTAVAASSDLDEQRKYRVVCKTVMENVESINSCSTIDTLKSQFAPQSEEYKALSKRRDIIQQEKTFNIDRQKIESMTSLYLNASEELNKLSEQTERLKLKNSSVISACTRKIAAIKRVTAAQANDLSMSLDSVNASYNALKKKTRRLSDDYENLQKQNKRLKTRLEDEKNTNLVYRQKIESSRSDVPKRENIALHEQNESLKSRLDEAQNTNLIYKQKIESSKDELRQKESTIKDLRERLRKTVTASSEARSLSSDLDDENRQLRLDLNSCKELLRSYQEAYSNVYASALGINPKSLSYTDSTSVAEMQKMIANATNTVNLPSTLTADPVYIDEDDSDDEIITM